MEKTDLLKTMHRRIDVSGVCADVTLNEVERIAAAAKHYQFICAFALPCFTPRLVALLREEKDVSVGATIGFPSGADTTAIKVFSAKEQIAMGIDEIDMVINIGALKSGCVDAVRDDIRAVVDTAGGRYPVKCILEIGCLTDDEIRLGSEIAVQAGASYVKTGTGWGPKPTTVETIRLIKSTIGESAKIKAAGGVRSLQTMLDMIDAGCDRFGIGLHSVLKIMREIDARLDRTDDFVI